MPEDGEVLQFGSYWVNTANPLGQGRGGVVFPAHTSRNNMDAPPTAAAKYPANMREVRTMEALQGNGRTLCPGVPTVFDSGMHTDKPWVVMELLGAPVTVMLSRLRLCSSAIRRWHAICALGRLLLRRLQAIHERGFVHCDIKPDNVLVGRGGGSIVERWMPFLIDFGCAHPYPGGESLATHAGTIEYNSIRSAEGGARMPCDDLEMLGWMLCYGMVGELPWFSWIQSIDWGDKPRRAQMCQRVKEAKIKLLEGGAGSFMATFASLPRAMVSYLRLCRFYGEVQASGFYPEPDYEALARLLGATAFCWDKDEREDIAIFQRLNEAGLDQALPPVVNTPKDEKERYFVIATWNSWEFEEMQPDRTTPGLYTLAVKLPQDGGEFQVVRNRDLNEIFHPTKRHKPVQGESWEACTAVGPDHDVASQGLTWCVNEKAGVIIQITYRRTVNNGIVAKTVSWQKPRSQTSIDNSKPSKKYFAVGSWDNWGHKHEMKYVDNYFVLDVRLGHKGLESFQILENGDWSKKLHPNMRRANPHVTHMLMGPEKDGHGLNWTIGDHPRDWSAPGKHYEVRLIINEGRPQKVEWKRLENPNT